MKRHVLICGVGEEPLVPNERKQDDLGITRRELEILELIAQA